MIDFVHKHLVARSLACVSLVFVCAFCGMTAVAQQLDSPSKPASVVEYAENETTDSSVANDEKSNIEIAIDHLEETFPEDSGLVQELAKVLKRHKSKALINNDAIVFGILMVMLGLIFWTSKSNIRAFKVFYKIVPMLLVCYFLPSLLTFFHIVDPKNSSLYFVATRYLLPATLVLLTLNIDLKEIIGLGPKALIMFLTGTIGVVIGGPIAVLIVASIAPDIIGVDGPEAVCRGLSTVAGSWIGGGANQAAMQVVFMTPDPDASAETVNNLQSMYSVMVAVDVFVAEIWMLFLLLGVGKADTIDRFFKADSSSIEHLKNKMESFSKKVARIPTATDLMVIGAIGFGATALAHYFGTMISDSVSQLDPRNHSGDDGLNSRKFRPQFSVPFPERSGACELLFLVDCNFDDDWNRVVVYTLPKLRGRGASKIGTVFIYILVAVIGMGMDIRAVVEYPGFFLIGGIWMLLHVALMFAVGWTIRAPYFFLAVGSKANIGGAASAPVVAAAFHPALAPVGVLLAVLGYALGTYGAMICAWMMQAATPG